MKKRTTCGLYHHCDAHNPLSLPELQLLQLGLWIIGEQDRVDLKLLSTYTHLRDELKDAAEHQITAIRLRQPSTEQGKRS